MTASCYPLEQILCTEQRGVVSLTGGGGKTSLLFHLAHALAQTGKKVLTTTTTRILVPSPEQSRTVIIDANPEKIVHLAASHVAPGTHITVAAHKDQNDKLHGFAPEAIRVFKDSGLFDWILIEADGAARRPLKAPAEHEPVISPDTTVLVAVVGLEVLGQPLSEKLVFRSDLAGPLMGLAVGEVITAAALTRLFAHPNGSFKGAPSSARRYIFLNKADMPDRLEYGSRMASHLRHIIPPIAETLIVGQALARVNVHAVYSLVALT